MGHFYKKKQTYTYPPKDTRTLQISKACLENQASVSVYLEKMLGGKWHVFEFHQVWNEIDFSEKIETDQNYVKQQTDELTDVTF